MVANMLDTYTQGLAALKRRFSSADQTGQQDIKKEGLQYRQKALADGVDLNQLEDSTNKLMDPNYNAAGANQYEQQYEQNYRADLFKQVSSTPRVGELPTVSPVTTTAPRNQYYDKTDAKLAEVDTMTKTPYVYNPDNDPLVAGARSNAAKRSKLATGDMMEEMNSRGILNSTVTSDRATDIHNQSEDQVTAMLPQFAQMGYANHQQGINNQFALASSYKGMGDTEMQNTFSESDRTGIYKNPALTSLYDKVIQMKKIAENPNATSEQFNAAKMGADELRRQISQLGGNPDLVGFENDASQASQAVGKYGSLTMQAQKSLADTFLGIGHNYSSLPTGTGNLIGQLPLYNNSKDFVTGLEGKKTIQGEQLGISQQNATTAANKSSKVNLPSYTETSKKGVIDMGNQILSRATNKQDALAHLNEPDVIKDMLNDGISSAEVRKYIEDSYAADPKAAKPGGPTESEIWAAAQKDWATDDDYNAADATEKPAIEEKFFKKWKKRLSGN